MEPFDVIFCVNSGRVGSKYLAELVDTTEEAHGLHEPDPVMGGPFVEMVTEAPEADSFRQRLVKCRAIEDWMRTSGTKSVYCETNHLFVVTFHDVAVATFPRIKVIFLRRSLPVVVKSFVELGYFSEHDPGWPGSHISPNAATAAIPAIASDAELDHVDRVIAHLLDIEARGARFRDAHPEILAVDVRLEDLTMLSGAERFFAALGLTATGATAGVIANGPINHKIRKKAKRGLAISVDECRRRIGRYLERASELGIEVPSSLAVD
jgi:hypothetical protein